MTSRKFRVVLAASALAVAAPSLLRPAVADDCLTDWGKAGEIVRREKLLTVEQLAANAKADQAGTIVKSTLCIQAGGYVYRLVIRAGDGHLKSTVVPAKDAKKP